MKSFSRIAILVMFAVTATTLKAAMVHDFTSFTLASANNGGNGTDANNIAFFDGVANTPFSSRAEPFATGLYLRERSDALTVRQVQANVIFDVSSYSSSVQSATLNFTGYISNANLDTVSISRLDGAMSYGATGSLPHTFTADTYGASFADGSTGTSGLFAVDVTDIVNSWIGGTTNNGFLLQLVQPATAVNDGFGIADTTGDGTVLALTVAVPEPATMSLLALGGVVAVLRRRKK